MESLKPKPKAAKRKYVDIRLVPIIDMQGVQLDPFAPLDPYFLLKVYGAKQLRTALVNFSVADLKVGAEVVEKRNPGTKPKSRAARQALTDYIVEYVAGTDY